MAPAAVQKLVGNQGVQRQIRRHQTKLVGTEFLEVVLLDDAALFLPVRPLRRRPDDIAILQQVLVELPIHHQVDGQPEMFVLFPELLELLELVDPALLALELDLPLQVVLVRRCLQLVKIGGQVLFNGLFEFAAVTALIEQENQQAGHDQAKGHPRRAFPVDGVLSGDNQHGRSQFITICP